MTVEKEMIVLLRLLKNALDLVMLKKMMMMMRDDDIIVVF
jgi:hypothetical protein